MLIIKNNFYFNILIKFNLTKVKLRVKFTNNVFEFKDTKSVYKSKQKNLIFPG